MSRHQRHDANVVKWLSFVSPVNFLSGMGKICELKRWVFFFWLGGGADSELTSAHDFYR